MKCLNLFSFVLIFFVLVLWPRTGSEKINELFSVTNCARSFLPVSQCLDLDN